MGSGISIKIKWFFECLKHFYRCHIMALSKLYIHLNITVNMLYVRLLTCQHVTCNIVNMLTCNIVHNCYLL